MWRVFINEWEKRWKFIRKLIKGMDKELIKEEILIVKSLWKNISFRNNF